MEQIPTKNCELCNKSKGVFFCYECKKALCQPCRETHDNIPDISHHKIIDLQLVDKTAITSRSGCSSHQKECSLFCSTCKVQACTQCVTTTHRNHSFLDIAEVAAEARNLASNYIADMKENQKKLSTLISKVKSDINDFKKEAAETMADIDCVVREIVGIIDAQKEIKYTYVQDAEVLECQDLDVYLKNVEKIYKTYQRVCREFENLMSEKHDLTFYHCFNTLKRDFLELDSIPIESEYQHIPKFDGQTFAKVVTCFIGKQFYIGLCENCDETKARIKDLENQEQQLQIRYRVTDQERERLSKENDAIKRNLQDAEQRYRATEIEKERLSRENKDIKRNLEKAEQRYQTEMKRTEKENEDLSREIAAIQGELIEKRKRYETDMNIAKVEADRLSTENVTIIVKLKDTLKKLQEERQKTSEDKRKEEKEEELRKWKQAKEQGKRGYKCSVCGTTQYLNYKEQFAIYQATDQERERLSKENDAIKRNLKDAEQRYQAIEKENERLSSENDHYERKLYEVVQRLTLEENEKDHRSRQNSALKEQLRDTEQRYGTELNLANVEAERLSTENTAIKEKLQCTEKLLQEEQRKTSEYKRKEEKEEELRKWQQAKEQGKRRYKCSVCGTIQYIDYVSMFKNVKITTFCNKCREEVPHEYMRYRP